MRVCSGALPSMARRRCGKTSRVAGRNCMCGVNGGPERLDNSRPRVRFACCHGMRMEGQRLFRHSPVSLVGDALVSSCQALMSHGHCSLGMSGMYALKGRCSAPSISPSASQKLIFSCTLRHFLRIHFIALLERNWFPFQRLQVFLSLQEFAFFGTDTNRHFFGLIYTS